MIMKTIHVTQPVCYYYVAFKKINVDNCFNLSFFFYREAMKQYEYIIAI